MIHVQNLTFQYTGSHHLTINIPSLNIEKGDQVLLRGASGCGKTTLLGLIAGILTPTSGKLQVLGRNMSELSTAQRDSLRGNHIGYIFQMLNLVPYLNVEQNIALSCHMGQKRMQRVGKDNLTKKIEKLANNLGLLSLLKQEVTRLSVGQQQRVAVARALLGNPELIIADEPTSALDTGNRESFLKLLFEQCETAGATLLFVSHDDSLQSLFRRNLALSQLNLAHSTFAEE